MKAKFTFNILVVFIASLFLFQSNGKGLQAEKNPPLVPRIFPLSGYYNTIFCLYDSNLKKYDISNLEIQLDSKPPKKSYFGTSYEDKNGYCTDENGESGAIAFTVPKDIPPNADYTVSFKENKLVYPLIDTSFIYKDGLVMPYNFQNLSLDTRNMLLNSTGQLDRLLQINKNNFPKTSNYIRDFIIPLPKPTPIIPIQPTVPNKPIVVPPSKPIVVPPSKPIVVPPSKPIVVPPTKPISTPPKSIISTPRTINVPTTPLARTVQQQLRQPLSLGDFVIPKIANQTISGFSLEQKQATITILKDSSVLDEFVAILDKQNTLESIKAKVENSNYRNKFDYLLYDPETEGYTQSTEKYPQNPVCSQQILSVRVKKGIRLSGDEKIELLNEVGATGALFGSDPMPRLSQPSAKTQEIAVNSMQLPNSQTAAQSQDYKDFQVAIVDGGVSTIKGLKNNVELGFNIVKAMQQKIVGTLKPTDAISRVNNTQDTKDEYVSQEAGHPDYNQLVGHGTAIASIISSFAPNTKLFPVKVCDAEGTCSGFDTVVGICKVIIEHQKNRIDKKMGHRFDVLHFSLSSDRPSSLLNQALTHAIRAGITVVASAGNIGHGQACAGSQTASIDKADCVAGRRFPAYDSEKHKKQEVFKGRPWVAPDLPELITVGSVSRLGTEIGGAGSGVWSDGSGIGEIGSDGQLYHTNPRGNFRLSEFSPDGGYTDNSNKSWVSLVAPGENVISTKIGNCTNSKPYCFRAYSGTSFAAPWVTAAVIRLLKLSPSFMGQPQLIKKCITNLASFDYGSKNFTLYFRGSDKTFRKLQELRQIRNSKDNLIELFGLGLVQMPDDDYKC